MDSKSNDFVNFRLTFNESSTTTESSRAGEALCLSIGEPASAQELKQAEDLRPRTRADCIRIPRPCPYISCRYNLFFDEIYPGLYRPNYPEWDPKILDRYMCALDHAHNGGMHLEEVGQIFNLTRERIRQIEEHALDKLRKHAAKSPALSDFQTKYEGREALAELLAPSKRRKAGKVSGT